MLPLFGLNEDTIDIRDCRQSESERVWTSECVGVGGLGGGGRGAMRLDQYF